jgi:hypothetical protein
MPQKWITLPQTEAYGYIEMTSIASSVSPNLQDFSYSIWAKTTSVYDHETPCGAFWCSNATAILNLGFANGSPYFYLKMPPSPVYVQCPSAVLLDGKPHLLAVTCDRDSATGLKLYVDGQLVATSNPTSRVATDYSGAQNTYLEGRYGLFLDQFRFYKSVILTPEQVSAIYANKKGRLYDPVAEGLAATFVMEFDEENGNPIDSVNSIEAVLGDMARVDGGVLFPPERVIPYNMNRNMPSDIFETPQN